MEPVVRTSRSHVEEHDRLTYRARFLEAIDEGLADADAGRVISSAELDKRLDAKFGKRTVPRPRHR